MKFKKNKKGTGAARPTRLPFGAAKPHGLASPPLSPTRRRPHRSTQRRPRDGCTPASWTRRWPIVLPRSGRHPVPPGAILSPPRSTLSSSSLFAQRQQPQRRSAVRHWHRSPAPNSGHPRSIKPTPSSASTSATSCARSRPSASR